MTRRSLVGVLILMALLAFAAALAQARNGAADSPAAPGAARAAASSAWYATAVTRSDFGDNVVAHDLVSGATRVLHEAPYTASEVTCSGVWAAWTEAKAADPSAGSDLWVADLRTGSARQVSSPDGSVWSPTIAGGWLSWVLQTSDSATVQVLALTSGDELRVGPSSGYQSLLGASRDWIVWMRGMRVRAYDAASGTSRVLGRGYSMGLLSLVAGKWAVWQTPRGGGLVATDLAEGGKRLLCRSGARTEQASDIALSTRVVAWLDYRNGGVRAVGLGSGRRFLVTRTSDVYALAAWRTWVVWQRGRTHRGIYAANLATGQRLKLCGPSGADNGPQLVGPWVVWSGAYEIGGTTVFHARNLEDGRQRRFSL